MSKYSICLTLNKNKINSAPWKVSNSNGGLMSGNEAMKRAGMMHSARGSVNKPTSRQPITRMVTGKQVDG